MLYKDYINSKFFSHIFKRNHLLVILSSLNYNKIPIYRMKRLVKIQQQKEKDTKWQSIERCTRKRQKKKRVKDKKSELDPGEIVST